MLTEKFSYEEQASLVWQFLCSIPVNLMAEFLPWLSSSISSDEYQDMRRCLCKVIPEEKLLRQVMIPFCGHSMMVVLSEEGCSYLLSYCRLYFPG